jgi:hypothetical protein
MNRVSTVERDRPEKTTIPNGCKNSPPSPGLIARGNMPKTVVTVVIRMGRSRWGDACKIAS